MNNVWYYGGVAIVLIAVELIYFFIAQRVGIIDKPNERSSHQMPTVRGGGVIFVVATVCWFFVSDKQWIWFFLSILAVSIINFLDDIKPRSAFRRFTIHLCAVLLIFYQIPFTGWAPWLYVLALIISIGALSAFNFMDGINGITGTYALVTLSSFVYINYKVVPFTSTSLLLTFLLAVFIFLFFNFRKNAICFAGDVGSVTIAFIQIFFLLQLIQVTGNLIWVILFLIYGLDSVITIVYRLKRKENIFKPHRTHLYQYLSNEFNWPHRIVSLLYGIAQLVINWIVCYDIPRLHYSRPLVVALLFIIIYVGIRREVMMRIGKLNG
jgi:UDP-N-acetylmuramyl pentapeptide phosphotransferase/UDP-N-acetylglucosamine-1-phosphate transferase